MVQVVGVVTNRICECIGIERYIREWVCYGQSKWVWSNWVLRSLLLVDHCWYRSRKQLFRECGLQIGTWRDEAPLSKHAVLYALYTPWSDSAGRSVAGSQRDKGTNWERGLSQLKWKEARNNGRKIIGYTVRCSTDYFQPSSETSNVDLCTVLINKENVLSCKVSTDSIQSMYRRKS